MLGRELPTRVALTPISWLIFNRNSGSLQNGIAAPPHRNIQWHLLMSIDNKSGWPAEFTVSSSTLAAQLGVSRTQLSRCRKELKDAGRLIHIRQKGSQPPIYRLAAFEPPKAEPAAKVDDPLGEPSPRRQRLPANSPHRLNRVNLHLVR